jgi:putative phage-type endonuclease
MIKYNIEQCSEAWFNIRLGRVTGTSFKDLMAKKETAAYRNLIADIAAEKITGLSEDADNYESEWMTRGKELEPIAANYYSELFDIELEQTGFVTFETDNKYFNWCGVSPDRLIKNTGILEIKCPKRSTHWYYLQSEKLPSEYYWQVMGQLFVTGADYCDFMSFYPDLKPFIIQVLPDKKAFEQIEKELDILIEKVNLQISNYNQIELL